MTLYHELGSLVVLDFEEEKYLDVATSNFFFILKEIEEFNRELDKLAESTEMPIAVVKVIHVLFTALYVLGEINRRLHIQRMSNEELTAGNLLAADLLMVHSALLDIRITAAGRANVARWVRIKHNYTIIDHKKRAEEEARKKQQDFFE